MRIIKHRGLEIEIYDSIEQRPAYRHMNFNKNLMIESGIGSDLSSFDRKLATVALHIQKDNKSAAQQVMENMRQNLAFIMQNVTPKMVAFCYLIHSINGEEVGFMTDDKAQKMIDTDFKEFDMGWFDRIIHSVKKKTTLSSLSTSQS